MGVLGKLQVFNSLFGSLLLDCHILCPSLAATLSQRTARCVVDINFCEICWLVDSFSPHFFKAGTTCLLRSAIEFSCVRGALLRCWTITGLVVLACFLER